MKLLVASGLTAALLTGSVGAFALVAGPPDHVDLPEQVTLPELPEQVPDEVPVRGEAELPETPEPDGEPASETGRDRREAALAFVGSMQAWAECVSEAAAAHQGSTDSFDPVEACGSRPAPPVPAHAAEHIPPIVPPAAPPVSPPAGPGNVPGSGEAGQEFGEEQAEAGQSRGEQGADNAPVEVPTGRP